MIKFVFSVLTVVFLLGASTLVNGQQVFRATPKSVIPYLEYLPQDYNSNSNKYPVVFFLHGIGERGPNTTNLTTLESGVWTITRNGLPKLVKNGQQFPFILISIQLKNNYGTWPTWYVLEVINHVKTYLRIDERKMHITGLSMGGGGTFGMAFDYPHLFATASPICAGYNTTTSKASIIANENLPIWAFHGDADTTVPYTRTVNMINAINSCSPVPSPKAKVTIYPGVNHNSWDRAYSPDHTYHNPNLYEWMLSYTNTTSRGNKIPVATACTDKSISGSAVTLTSSATDGDGSIASYSWKKISGNTCTLANASASSLSVSNLSGGKYVFAVTATDSKGATDTDYVQVTVEGSTSTTLTANAGADLTVTAPTTTTSISGSGTGTISSYKWTFVSGPKTPVLTNTTTARVSVSDLTLGGNYTFKLEVRNSAGAVAYDQVQVIVATSNLRPVANAGPDITLTSPTNSVTINGSGTDKDGTIVKYAWSQVSGPMASTFAGANTAKLSVTNMNKAGTYIFKLTVTDNLGLTNLDKVYVTIESPSM